MVPSPSIALALQALTWAVTGQELRHADAEPLPASAAAMRAAPAAAARVDREAWVMGTRLRLVAEAAVDVAAREATEVVLREMERMEGLLSTWVPSTEASRLNRTPVGARITLSPELHDLLREARAWAERTEGAFEPSVGALVDAWDLRGEGRVPDASELRRALAATGSAAWRLAPDARSAERLDPLLWIDTGGFGKGAALRSSGTIAERAVPGGRILVDLGGQVWAAAPPEQPWTVPVAHPARRGEPLVALALHGGVSAATSGASERWIEVEGERLGHILDPRAGVPVPAWGTVTVVHEDALVADVLATALYVMGPDEGVRWLEGHPDVAALFLDARSGAVLPHWTAAMEAWLTETEPQP